MHSRYLFVIGVPTKNKQKKISILAELSSIGMRFSKKFRNVSNALHEKKLGIPVFLKSSKIHGIKGWLVQIKIWENYQNL